MSSKRDTGYRNWDQTDPGELQTTPEIKKTRNTKAYYKIEETAPGVFEVINNYGDVWLVTRQADATLVVDERPENHKKVDDFIVRAIRKQFG